MSSLTSISRLLHDFSDLLHMNIVVEIPLHNDCPTQNLPSVKKLTGGNRHQLLEQVHHLLSDLLPYRLETRPKQTFATSLTAVVFLFGDNIFLGSFA